ncbi:MAG TPA: choice-of-anchor D domain-containing protein [Bryobacteraceae bacterium]|nr:choice-of-anchor D domain-containing protein [Bryobacteraceae bacterium]
MRRGFLLLSLIATPFLAQAQFSLSVQQNGTSVNIANGGVLTVNAPAVGQSASATVTITYIGTGTATFPSPVQFQGSTSFSGGSGTVTLKPLDSTSFPVNYKAASFTQALATVGWAFNEVSTAGIPITNGVISLNLVGTAPNVVVGQLTSGSFVPINSGGTITLPDTLVGVTSTAVVNIVNSGSGAATVTSIGVAGSGYTIVGIPLLPANLNPNTTLTLTVQFTPTTTGVANATLQANFASGSWTSTLTGKGISSFLQYQLNQNGTTSSLTPGQTISFSAAVGGKAQATIQFQNVETLAFLLGTIVISGAGFTLTDTPFLPTTLQPQQTNTVTITFTPPASGSVTGRLQIGSDSFFLNGSGLGPLLQFSYSPGGSPANITPPGPVVFPVTGVGSSTTFGITITNAGTTQAQIGSIGVLDTTGTFTLTGLPTLPVQLAPNASVSFSAIFAPHNAGQATTALLVDTTTINLTGIGAVFSLAPPSSFTGASGSQQPFAQPAIGLTLSSPYPVDLQGVVTMLDTSLYFAADPAVQFSTGGRTVAFTIPANTLQAIFANGAPLVRFQTGTVASIITFTPSFLIGTTNVTPPNPPVLTITVPSLAPVELSASLSGRTLTSFTVTVHGYTTTRNIEKVTVTLTPTSGSNLSATTFTADVTAAAQSFFQTGAGQATGGQFNLDLPFTLSNGNTSSTSTTDLTKEVQSVAVTVTNEVGSSNTLPVILP